MSQDMFETRKSSNSISIDSLNPEISKKVSKFNTSNDGELTLEQAIQGLVTLQKQSNNYKKMIWMLIPVLMGLIAATFGTTMLAFKLNQQTQLSGSTLTDMNGNTVKVATQYFTESQDSFANFMLSKDALHIQHIITDHFNLNVWSVIQSRQENSETADSAVILTPFCSILVDSTIAGSSELSVQVYPNPGFENSTLPQMFIGLMGWDIQLHESSLYLSNKGISCSYGCASFAYIQKCVLYRNSKCIQYASMADGCSSCKPMPAKVVTSSSKSNCRPGPTTRCI